jgi:hypothetical protein
MKVSIEFERNGFLDRLVKKLAPAPIHQCHCSEVSPAEVAAHLEVLKDYENSDDQDYGDVNEPCPPHCHGCPGGYGCGGPKDTKPTA